MVVLPFTALNPSQEQAWLGRSIQQSVLADLTTAAPGRLMSSDVEVTDMSAAAEIGRHAGANYVVHGSFTTLTTSAGQGLRIMGEVIDSANGRPVAAFKATGLYSEIFRLEDQVAAQIRQHMHGVLPPPVISVGTTRPVENGQVPEGAQADAASQPMPQVNEYYATYGTPQTYVPADAYYNYNYATWGGSPGWCGWWGTPCWGWGWGTTVFIGSSFHSHDHFHGGGFGGHPGNGFGGGGHVGVSPHVNGGIFNAGGGAGGAHGGGHR